MYSCVSSKVSRLILYLINSIYPNAEHRALLPFKGLFHHSHRRFFSLSYVLTRQISHEFCRVLRVLIRRHLLICRMSNLSSDLVRPQLCIQYHCIPVWSHTAYSQYSLDDSLDQPLLLCITHHVRRSTLRDV